jgi:hypothetical protein
MIRNFVIKHAQITAGIAHKCYGCRFLITFNDGPKFVIISVPEQQPLNFHEECFDYFVTGLLRFLEVFIRERRGEKEPIKH